MKFTVEVIQGEDTVKFLNRLDKWADTKGKKVTWRVAEDGKRFAFNMAPKKTRALVNAIATGVVKGNGAAVISRQPQRKSNGVLRPYHFFMHGIRANGFPFYDTSGKIRSGDPRYMDTTAKYLSKTYPEKISKSLDKTIKQK